VQRTEEVLSLPLYVDPREHQKSFEVQPCILLYNESVGRYWKCSDFWKMITYWSMNVFAGWKSHHPAPTSTELVCFSSNCRRSFSSLADKSYFSPSSMTLTFSIKPPQGRRSLQPEPIVVFLAPVTRAIEMEHLFLGAFDFSIGSITYRLFFFTRHAFSLAAFYIFWPCRMALLTQYIQVLDVYYGNSKDVGIIFWRGSKISHSARDKTAACSSIGCFSMHSKIIPLDIWVNENLYASDTVVPSNWDPTTHQSMIIRPIAIREFPSLIRQTLIQWRFLPCFPCFLGVFPNPMWGPGTGMSMCTDCKALWGKFVIRENGLYKINWILNWNVSLLCPDFIFGILLYIDSWDACCFFCLFIGGASRRSPVFPFPS